MTPGSYKLYLLICVLVSGCASVKQQEVLENRLRQREDQIIGLKSNLEKMETELKNTREQLAFCQQQGEAMPVSHVLPEQSESLFSVKSIKIDPLHTGFVMQGEDPLKSKLNVVVTPFDDAGEIIRVPGTVELIVYEITDNNEREIERFNYDLHETAKSWQRGFFISGFQYFLPITCKEQRIVKVHSRFTTTDQRVFEAFHQVKCTDLLNPMPAKPADQGTPESQKTEPARLETSVNWLKDEVPLFR